MGDIVYLIHLEESGEVIRLSGPDMAYVKVDDMEIPVYYSDITKNIPLKKEEKKEHNPEKKIHPGEIKKDQSPPNKPTDSGIFISFEPVKDRSDSISHFKIFLVNDTAFPAAFRYWFSLAGETNFELEKIVQPYQPFLLHEIEYDALNEIPVIELDVRDVMNRNFKGTLSQKIRPQNFFNKLSKMH